MQARLRQSSLKFAIIWGICADSQYSYKKTVEKSFKTKWLPIILKCLSGVL